MIKRIDILKRTIGDWRTYRLLEIINILGLSLPDDFDIYTYVPQYSYPKDSEWIKDCSDNLDIGRIFFQDDPNNRRENYIEFGNNSVELVCISNGKRYHWSCIFGKDDDDIYGIEDLSVNYGRLTARFSLNKQATCTSLFYLHNDSRSTHVLISDTRSIKILKKGSRALPIQKYYDVFKAYMKDGKENVLTCDPDVVDTIIKVFEGPILYLVDSLTKEDQSWRFDYEETEIASNYEKEVKKSYELHAKEVSEAVNHLKNSLNSYEKIRKSKMRVLEKLRKKYDTPNTSTSND